MLLPYPERVDPLSLSPESRILTDETVLTTVQRQPLEMKFAGEFVKRLGLEMYAGPTPAIAELVANAWDADAGRVYISVPLDMPLSPSSEISVSDNGIGMSYDECNEKYLIIGRDRRKIEGDTSAGNRRIMAHKGIGKLAGFGIADTIEIRTVRDRELTHFRLDYKKIEDLQRGETYRPDILKAGVSSKESNGTEVILRDIRLTEHTIHKGRFELGLARRFAVFSDTFKVYVNENMVEKKHGVFQFKFPQPGKDITMQDDWWGVEQIPSAGTVKWWIGFTKKPIPEDESRGVTVLARGKLAQNPWFFQLSGGAWGQFGLQYMTGEVQADFIDEHEDLVSSDRQSILWERPTARELLVWGQKTLLSTLRKWAELRAKESLEELKKTKLGKSQETFLERIEKFPSPERAPLLKVIDNLVKIETIEPEQLTQAVSDVLNVFEDVNLRGMLTAISDISPDAQVEILNIIREYSVIEAVQLAKVVKMHLAVIMKFEKMIDRGVPERPDMQELLASYPWLVDSTWLPMRREVRLDKLVASHFRVKPILEGGRRFLDFVCLADSGRIVVLELKRPGERIGKKELRQVADYVDYLFENQEQISDVRRKRTVQGYLIGAKYDPGARREVERMEVQGIYTLTWNRLLTANQQAHEDFLKVIYARAPKDDPRIKDLQKMAPIAFKPVTKKKKR